MGRIYINYLSVGDSNTPSTLCDTGLPSNLTVSKPTDTPNTGWNNENLLGTTALSGDVEFNFTLSAISQNVAQMIGLDSDNPDAGWVSLDYAIYILYTGFDIQARVYESGTFKFTLPNLNINDQLTIRRTGNTVEYLINNTLEYTSLLIDPGLDLAIGSSFLFGTGFWEFGDIVFNNISYCQI